MRMQQPLWQWVLNGRDYFDKLRSVGFKVDEVDYTASLSPKLVDTYRLAAGEILPVCHKIS